MAGEIKIEIVYSLLQDLGIAGIATLDPSVILIQVEITDAAEVVARLAVVLRLAKERKMIGDQLVLFLGPVPLLLAVE